MRKFIQENIREFWRGVVGGSVTGGSILYIKQGILSDYFLSLFTVGISALIGGMFTALAADIYKHRIQKRLFKNKKDKQQDNEKAA